MRVATILMALWLAACNARPSVDRAVETFGTFGGAPGQFRTPRGLDWSGDRLWVVDRSGRLQAFDREFEPLVSIVVAEGDRGFPLGLLGDDRGGVTMCDTHRGRLRFFDATGQALDDWAGDSAAVGGLSLPQRAVRHADGRLFVCEFGEGPQNRIRVLDAQGGTLATFGGYGRGPGQLTRAMALCIFEDELYCADASDRILVFSLDGRFRREFGSSGVGAGELRYPYGLCAWEGLLYVCEYANNRLQRFTRDGQARGIFGGPGHAPGEFSGPWDLCLGPDGRLWVADSGNHRVQAIDLAAVHWEDQE
ncbi:MAG: hypothetical protein KDB53_13510 [Planctomycetes bacterium]|nr:hypothetical protein [Planctomycetota bacterium]